MQTNVETLIDAVRFLPKSDRLRLVDAILHDGELPKNGRSLRELRGLGKGIWKDVDAQKYVDAERDAWEN